MRRILLIWLLSVFSADFLECAAEPYLLVRNTGREAVGIIEVGFYFDYENVPGGVFPRGTIAFLLSGVEGRSLSDCFVLPKQKLGPQYVIWRNGDKWEKVSLDQDGLLLDGVYELRIPDGKFTKVEIETIDANVNFAKPIGRTCFLPIVLDSATRLDVNLIRFTESLDSLHQNFKLPTDLKLPNTTQEIDAFLIGFETGWYTAVYSEIGVSREEFFPFIRHLFPNRDPFDDGYDIEYAKRMEELFISLSDGITMGRKEASQVLAK